MSVLRMTFAMAMHVSFAACHTGAAPPAPPEPGPLGGSRSPPAAEPDVEKYFSLQHPEEDSGDWRAFYAKARAQTREARARADVVYGVPYGASEKQKLDVYMPRPAPHATRRRAVVVFFHGGGFVEGDRADYGYVAQPLVEAGVVVVVASYRLAPERFPAQLEDARAALSWSLVNSDKLGAPRDKVFAVGYSAGGILAAEACVDTTWTPPGSAPLAGCALLSAPYDLRPLAWIKHFVDADEARRQASPLLNVSAPARTMLVGVGEKETQFREQANLFTSELRRKGVCVEEIVAPGATHDAVGLALGANTPPVVPGILRLIDGAARCEPASNANATPKPGGPS